MTVADVEKRIQEIANLWFSTFDAAKCRELEAKLHQDVLKAIAAVRQDALIVEIDAVLLARLALETLQYNFGRTAESPSPSPEGHP